MDEILALLPADAQERARQQAQQAALLQLGFGLLGASRGQPGQGRPSVAQAIGQVGPQALQAYQGSIDQTLQAMLTRQKLEEAKRQSEERKRLEEINQRFRDQIAGAVKTVPSTNLAEGGQQASMLAQQMAGFSPEDYAGTQQALFGAGATRQVQDEAAANRAVMDYLRLRDPLEYAKLTFKSSDEPEQVRTLRALLKDPALMSAYLSVKKAGAPSTELKVDMANRQAMFKEVDIPIIQGFTNAASSAREFAQVSDTINNLLKGAGGGKFVQVGTDVARNLGIAPGQVAAADLAQSLVTQAAPKMRAPNSGSTSDMEFKSYMNSIPSLASSESGRELMAKYSRAFAERNAKLADYARSLAKDDKLSFDLIQKYDQTLGPVLKDDFYKFAPPQGGTLDFRSGVRGGR